MKIGYKIDKSDFRFLIMLPQKYLVFILFRQEGTLHRINGPFLEAFRGKQSTA